MNNMKLHESINTAIAVLGFAIASVTAWKQFGPNPDSLDIEVSSPIANDLSFQRVTGYIDTVRAVDREVAGPVFWEITAYNSLDRTVTIKDIETYLLSEGGGYISYSDLELGVFDRKLKPLELPLTISARSAQVLVIGLNIPIVKDKSKESNCYGEFTTLKSYEKCRYKSGFDMFGNPVNYSEFGSGDNPKHYSVSWEQGNDSPRFITMLRTGDNSKLHYRLQYYPFAK